MLGEWKLGSSKSTGGGIVLVSVVFAAVLTFTGWQIGAMRDQRGPLLAEKGPNQQAPTVWPSTSVTVDQNSQQGALAPGPPPESVRPTTTPSESPRPVPVPAGRWSGVASVAISGQELGCKSVTKTFRLPATLRLSAPAAGDPNAVQLTFDTDAVAAEGSFRVASTVAGSGPRAASLRAVGYWTLSGDGAGGFVGNLHRPAMGPVDRAGEIDNLLYATRGLDDQCGSLLSAPLSFPMGSGSSLRLTSVRTARSLQIAGRTSDNTRSFRITWASG
ncbi:hypothetical protein [Cryptosporangium sp. NPDC051539]|uniref:hypothetical protein n=1 Tax=Cryptosporangium sp. NPDC051539 TaxID=3363962 RepID=UPI0037BD8249